MAKKTPYILGLDLGASSLGWATISLDRAKGKPVGISAAGVRIFEAGVEGDIEQGKDASRAVVRREARQPRRQQWRRQQRKRNLFTLLQKLNLLPPSEGNQPDQRKALFDALDEQLAKKFLARDDHDAQQKLPYILRQKAGSEPAEPFELGRALYHLGQRRGYRSNRKGQGEDESDGAVATGIGELQEKMEEHGDTLGSYFALRHDPFNERIRRRYTSRAMYQQEFDQIKQTQQASHKNLDDAAWKKIYDAIFYQRPLKSQKHLIGRCDLEPQGKKWKLRRCPIALPIAQEFRILQKVNDLRVYTKDRSNDPLSDEECQKLMDALWKTSELKWNKIKTLLKLPKGTRFSLEEGDDRVIGHRTNAKMVKAFGDRWLELSVEEQTDIVHELLHFRNPEALINRAKQVWGLDDEGADKLAKTHLEDDHARHSKRALCKLVEGNETQPGMREGAAYATVRRELYREQFTATEELSSLPPINDWKSDIRNPAVIRALTEVRKVVNAIIGKYGKPVAIHIELARDIRNSRVRRKDIWKKNQENRNRREKAVTAILKEVGIDNAKRHQTDKWLLADECNRQCPYCGKSINMHSLMGDDAQFNIEHIFPRRYLDDSYMNKTVACRKCNDEKGDHTPAQAFSGTRYDEILQRVERFQGTARNVKLARFKMEQPPDDPVARQLNDTRYNSKLAAEFLGLLYGGHSDADGKQRILTPTGMLTSKVRGNWHLNEILGRPNQEKERQDHRHHAIDAVVVALMTQKQTQQMAECATKHGDRHFFKSIPYPWETFNDDIRNAIEAINISHRPTRTIAGPLHAESIYSKNYGTEKKPEFRIRKELHKLSVKEISGDQIVEKSVREAVQKKYEALGGGQPAKVFTDRANHPTLKTKDGREIPIHKVRIRVDAKPRSVGKGPRQRNIASGKDSNYASMIYATLDKEGKETKWQHEIITRLEAHERLSANHGKEGEKVLIPEESETRKFKFALRKNDMILADGPDGEPVLYKVQSFSKREIQLCPHSVHSIRGKARNATNQIQSTDRLRQRHARRVEIMPMGDIAET